MNDDTNQKTLFVERHGVSSIFRRGLCGVCQKQILIRTGCILQHKCRLTQRTVVFSVFSFILESIVSSCSSRSENHVHVA